MIDERRLREMLERRAGTISATPTDPPKAVRRARRRLVLNAAVGTVVGFVVLVGALAGVRAIQTAAPIPADPPVEPRPAPAAAGTLTYILDGDIYVADPDGSNAVRIANGRSAEDCDGYSDEYWAEGSMWSPDGRYLAYRYTDCSDPESFGGIVISDAEGNVVTSFSTGGWQIAWSPDSTRVAGWDDIGGGTIGVYGLDGARQTQLTMPPGWTPSGDHAPVWMPDGTSVWIDGWALPVDGSTPRPLPLGSDPYPTFSPDGSLVAYSDNRSLLVARSDGSEPREVFGGWAEYSAWSPTGDRIAFSDGESLRLLDVATGEVTRLTEAERGTSLRVMGFSPEGDRVLFSTIESDSLWSIGVDGSDASLVVAGTWQGEWLSRPTAAKTTGQPTSTDARPTPAPAASGTLAYDLDGDIFVADPDGSNAVRVANGRPPEDCGGDGGEYWAEGPMWSPDGRYLAYRHHTDCSSSVVPWDVVISDAEGNVITTFPAQGWGVAWSPDSTRVAVWDSLYDPPATIGVYGLDGARLTQLTMPSGWSSGDNFDDDPEWMPDGTSLVIGSLEVPLDGGAPRQLPLPMRSFSFSNSYSPDGSRVAYVDVDHGSRWSLVVAAADGSDAREVAEGPVIDPVWSPTSDRIAFIYSEKATVVYPSKELRVLDVATGEVTSLVGMDGSWDIGIESIQFSPQGDRILFARYGRGADEYGLWSIGFDGSDPRLLVAGTSVGDWLSPS